MVSATEFGLLGPLMVRRGGVDLPVQRGKQRAVLAALLLEANQVVPVDVLAQMLWGPQPPPSAPVTLRNYVKRLRQALGEAGPALIRAQPRGYLIRVQADALDVSRFEALLRSAQAAARNSCWDVAGAGAREALSLWRGEPLADVESEVLALRERPRLAELRLQALETRIDAELRLGAHSDVIAELQSLVTAHPLRERLHALLMLALYRIGRQGEALAAYRDARAVLAAELGIEPGTGLRELHQQILTADPALPAPEPASAPAASLRPTPAAADGPAGAGRPGLAVPRQLPGVAGCFTGRGGELAQLSAVLDQAGGRAPGTVVISAIGGMAGVGKTALAVHWAHQVAHRFPDGQLYVNLRGFDPSGTPAPPAEAIGGFLDALGIEADRIPPGLQAQAGLYRSLVAGRQMLVVLDNARDEQQVRPLLPAGPRCLVIVTSRHQLAGLAAAEGACLITLDILSHADACQMLAARLGDERAAADPDAVADIAGLCARLPLALAVAAARAAARPGLSLANLAAELRHAARPLDALDVGDPAASVRAVISWSYQQLGSTTARMFRRLGLHPGPDITANAAASLAGVAPPAASRELRELATAHLLTEHTPGRYSFHDLLRAYASEQAATDDDAARRAAVGRVLDHYLHAAHAAALLLNPSLESITITPRSNLVTTEPLDDDRQALAWFDAERQVLKAAVTLAAQTGFDACAWQLPWAMTDFLDRRGHWHESVEIQQTALAAARRLGDKRGQAATCRLLSQSCVRLGDYAEARTHLAHCLELCRQLGDRAGEARAHQSLSWLAEHQGRYRDALHHDEQSLVLFEALGHQAWLAGALNAIGWHHALLGEPQRARRFCRQALALNRELGIRHGEAATWDSLGYAEHQLGCLTEAAACYQHALSIIRELGDRFNEAGVLTHLGDTQHAADDQQGARQAWQQALVILDDLHHPDADQIRAKLRDLGPARPARSARPRMA